MQKKTYAVLGLGRYGMAVAEELIKDGMDVMAVDRDEGIVQDAAAKLPVCKCADITDRQVLTELGIAQADVVIIAMASNLEASVLGVTLCKELRVPFVIAKCASETHQKILSRVGADLVVFPEQESGIRLAKNLLTSGFVDIFTLSDDLSVLELDVKKEWIGKNLKQLDLRGRYSVNVMAFRKNGKITAPVNPDEILEENMQMIAIGNPAKLAKLK